MSNADTLPLYENERDGSEWTRILAIPSTQQT